MASNKREREVARARYERQQARRAERAQRRSVINRAVAAAVSLAVVLAVVWLSVRDDGGTDDVASTSEPTPTASSSVAPVTCTDIGASPKDLSWDAAPEQRVQQEGPTYRIVFDTSCGQVEVTADAANAPVTTNSMIFLANEGYFDGTPCHRLTTQGIFVLQCGDPTGTGSGGPGYQIDDENLPTDVEGVKYPAGTVAMANSGANTNGSQFFIVYEDTELPPSYSVWGTVTKGLEVVQGIAAQGVEGGSGDGKPAANVVITKAQTFEDQAVAQ